MLTNLLRHLDCSFSIKNLDIFARKFSFTFQNKSTQKTVFGALLSILIVLIASLYFFYLLYIFVNGGISPTIVDRQIYNQNEIKFNEIVFKKSPIVIYVGYPGGQVPSDYNKIYATNKRNGKEVKLVDCSQQYGDRFEIGSQCIDMQSMENKISQNDSISFMFVKCPDIQENGNCSDQSKVDQFYENTIIYISIKIIGQQYDTSNRQIIEQISEKVYLLDEDMIQYSVEKIILSEIEVDNGLLTQSLSNYESIKHSRSDSSQLTKKNFVRKYNIFFGDLTKQFTLNIVYDIQPILDYKFIQYPKIGQVLAEFNSLFSILLLFGFLGKIFTYSGMQDHYFEFNNIKKKSSWKKFIHYITDMKYENDQKMLSDRKLYEKSKQLTDITEFMKQFLQLQTAIQFLYKPYQWKMLEYCKSSILSDQNYKNHLDLIRQDLNDSYIDKKSQILQDFEIFQGYDMIDQRLIECFDQQKTPAEQKNSIELELSMKSQLKASLQDSQIINN